MADPDGNPSGPSDPSSNLPSPAAKPVAPAPRSNPPNVNAGKEKAPPAGGPPGFNDFLEWMRTMSGDAPAAADQRNLIPKERKKFQRQDTEAKVEKPAQVAPVPAPVAPAPVTPAAPLEQPAPTPPTPTPVASAPLPTAPSAVVPPVAPAETQAAPDTSRATAEPSPRVRRGQMAPTKRNFWVGAIIQAGVAALLVVSFFVGRASVKKATAAADAAPAAPEITTQDGKTTTNVLSNANAALIDQAMAAIQESHFKEAGEALDKVKASGERIRGLTFQRAQLAVFANETSRAVPLLNEALAEGDNLGEAYNLRATVGSRRNLFGSGSINDYETASKLEPFNAQVFFYWGSALRRAGKSQEAIKRIQQALDRLREPTAEGYYRLCQRITQIEVGQEQGFADELARQLALPHPSIDWLFTAVALALRDGKYDAAAGYLDRAQACGDEDGFSLRLRDFYINQFDNRKELSRFYARPAPPKPGRGATPTTPDATPAPNASAAPLSGINVPDLPPPASPGATVVR